MSGNRRDARGRRNIGANLFTPPPGGTPNFSFFTDRDSPTGSAWGSANAVDGSPLVVTDSVTHASVVRTGTNDAFKTAAGAADILSTGASTLVLVWRARKYNPAGEYLLVDSTVGGTIKGYELRVYDNNADIFKFRVISPRIWNGSSYTLDTPADQTAGYFIPLKWHVIVVRLTSTTLDIRVDGRAVRRTPLAVSWSYLTAGSGAFKIGGGKSDYKAVFGYNSALSDGAVAAIEQWARRYGVNLVNSVAGNVYSTALFYGFPHLISPSTGRLYATYFKGATEGPADANTQHSIESFDGGVTWANDTVIQTNSASIRYADIGTTVLSNGWWLQTTYLYDAGGNITHLATRKSTDGGVTYSAWRDVTFAGMTWEATGACPIETTPGTLHWPVYALKNAEVKTSAWDYKSTDYGDTFPTRVEIAKGDTDGWNYEEPGFLNETGYIYCLVRRSSGATTMAQTRSTDGGATWAAVDDTTMAATSAARGLVKLTSGRYVWFGGRPNAIQEAAAYSRAPGAAWNADWNNVPDAPWIDTLYGGSAYGSVVETGPGVLTTIWGANTDATYDDVVSRANFYEWYLTHAMPGTVSPSIATISAGNTQQLTVTGAGDYTYALVGTSGGTVSVTGLYTAGLLNGTDTVTVTDLNSKTVGTFVATVINGVSALNPALIPGATSVYRADHSTNTGDGTQITAWNDELGLRNMAQPVAGQRLLYAAGGIHGTPDAVGNGARGMYADQTALGATALTLAAYVSWTAGVNRIIFGAQYNDYHYVLAVDVSTSGQAIFRIQTTTVAVKTIHSDSTGLNDGNPHSIIGTWDGATMKMYVDGVLQAETTAMTGVIDNPSVTNDNNSIGCALDGTNSPFSGFIGNIKGANSANTAISASDAAALHAWYATVL